jgi:hypothetical protein
MERKRMTIYDVTPNILNMMGVPVPKDLQGNVVPEIEQWLKS